MIIKCPECGKQVSDKAPTCPTCGVQIAGKVCQCQNCGEVYFSDQELCPACHQVNSNPQTHYRPQSPAQPAPVAPARPAPAQPAAPTRRASAANAPGSNTSNDPNATENPKKGNNVAAVLAALIFACIIGAGIFYLYAKNGSTKEDDAYALAMRAGHEGDEKSLQDFLAEFPNAKPEHIDSIKALLNQLAQKDQDWTNAYLTRSQTALQKFIDDNPTSPHVQEAKNMIDTLAWQAASQANTMESLQKYLDDHASGCFADDAKEALAKLKANTLISEDKEKVQGAVRRFFQSVNSKNEAGMINAVAPVMDKFLDKLNANSEDIRLFLQRNYKEGVTNVNWHIDASTYDIKKRQVAEDEYLFDATVNASRDTFVGEAKTTDNFNIAVTIDGNGLITSMTIRK